jgi:hypothetical protein
MSGWRTQIAGDYEPPKGVIGIVVAQKFPDPEVIRKTLEDGFARVAPDTVWVMREAERKGHAVNFAWQTFKAHGITPLLAPLVPAWKSNGIANEYDIETRKPSGYLGAYDKRAEWRDIEIRDTCERVIVFHDKSSNITADWIDCCEDRKEHPGDGSNCHAKIYVVERGKVKVKRYKKGRKPD